MTLKQLLKDFNFRTTTKVHPIPGDYNRKEPDKWLKLKHQ